MDLDINKEWENFVYSNYKHLSSDEEEDDDDNNGFDAFDDTKDLLIKNNSFESFCKEDENTHSKEEVEVPKSSPIYISTKTKIAYLNIPIDLNIFWNIPVISYDKPVDGVVKKQIKINSMDMRDLLNIQDRLKQEKHYEEQIITSINNPDGRIKFKDIRKISIGLCKKDIMSYRCKKKGAFYNCFVLILRMKVENVYKEYHVKVFNTGKLEIPGIKNDVVFDMILELVKSMLQPYVNEKLEYKENSCETVLINSNFNCGFFINREIFYDILKMKYNIQSIFDPCSYPGIQCKIYYDSNTGIYSGMQEPLTKKETKKVVIKKEDTKKLEDINRPENNEENKRNELSFMIFRTGSILIVGKCDEDMLHKIYQYLVNILQDEYKNIHQKITNQQTLDNEKLLLLKDKKKKIRKKNIIVSCASSP
jgi:TATA-box binding protein (TBP) (component of TFIID and TFIIIB)